LAGRSILILQKCDLHSSSRSYAGGQLGRADFPGILSPYGKIEIGILNPIEIKEDGVHTARASALHPDVYKISSPYPPGEYLLIENRQPVLSDLYLWQPGGIVIYHVDENTGGNGNRERGGPFLEGWPGNGAHYKVALLQADGKYELEQGLNNGHTDDFWKKRDVLGPGNGEKVATSSGTYPNTDSYAGGEIIVTGLQIDQFQEMHTGVWSFRVSNLTPLAKKQPSAETPSPPSQAPFSVNIFQVPLDERVNCYGPILNDPNFYCDCMDDCTAKSDFACACSEAQACCAAYFSSLDFDDPTTISPAPSLTPSSNPSQSPTSQPSAQPSKIPTLTPSVNPTGSQNPSSSPSSLPSVTPSVRPTSSATPSIYPSISMAPSELPTMIPISIKANGGVMESGFIAAIVLTLLILLILFILLLYKRLRAMELQERLAAREEEEEADGILRPLEDDNDGLSSLTPSFPSCNSHLSRLRYWGYNGSRGSGEYEPPPVPTRHDSGVFATTSNLDNYGYSV